MCSLEAVARWVFLMFAKQRCHSEVPYMAWRTLRTLLIVPESVVKYVKGTTRTDYGRYKYILLYRRHVVAVNLLP